MQPSYTEHLSRGQIKEVQRWSLSLVHRYRAPTKGREKPDSLTMVKYVLAHLRFIVPNRTAAGDYLQLEEYKTGKFRAEGYVTFWATHPVRLSDHEQHFHSGIGPEALATLRAWLPWIVRFAKNPETFFPLYLSMQLSEKAFHESDSRTRHLFNVMALEALLSSEHLYGKAALTKWLPKLLGPVADLYEPYRPAPFHDFPFTAQMPVLPLTEDLIRDICTLRNKIAHGSPIPHKWEVRTESRRGEMGLLLDYAVILSEAASATVRLTWLKIMQDKLQLVFSDKNKMEDYLRKLQ